MYDIFQLSPVRFPQGFLWGSSTAGHQIEGDNIHAQLWHQEQRGIFPVMDPAINAPSGKACDHLQRWREDVDLIAELGHQAYRMSVEWSRIEPAPGRWDETAIRFYVSLLERLNARGVKPWVTLCHFTHPQWFEELGGFHKAENLHYFERYLAYIVPHIAHLVHGWNVLNEFNGARAVDSGPAKLQMLRVHARGYHLIKQYSSAPVSSAHAFVHWMPRRPHDPFDRTMTELVDFCTNEFFFHAIRTGELVYPYADVQYEPEVKGTCDVWAVNSYTRHLVDARRADLEGPRPNYKQLRLLPMEHFFLDEFYPEGLTANLERLKDKPVYITENGCATTDDRWRIVYIALHLAAMAEALARGVDLRGYFYWSTMDNYEWYSFVPRFGLIEVDFTTFTRTPRPSAHFFREIIRRNGLDQETISAYLRELPTIGPSV